MRGRSYIRRLTGLVLVAGAAGCNAVQPDARRAVPSYDPDTGRLVQLAGDLNGDGRLDQWTYMDGNLPIRGEADTNGDGRIDRWEYFDERAALIREGTSTRDDGVEDNWSSAGEGAGETRIAHSRRRDRSIDRVEYYRAGELVRVEEDTNLDGRVDRWDVYESGALREVSLDTTQARGWPNRRLRYDQRGQLVSIEADDQGDGTFVRLPLSSAAAQEVPGVKQ